jgi:hypothetical protein
MSISEDLELLEQFQQEAEAVADEQEYLTGIKRREFVFMSVVAAAATLRRTALTGAWQAVGSTLGEQGPWIWSIFWAKLEVRPSRRNPMRGDTRTVRFAAACKPTRER